MAMLAEPRRKQKIINLRAKNNAWSNDSTKFGQRMLEKMGWTSGKGLGANENGITEHVVARYKNDDKGLGFEDKNDQWTKHEDDFNTLLANLSNATDKTETLHSGISLEDKSKKSKARIHYHKFTRGKDISRYSEKDLANIFGKKSFKNIELEQEEPLKEDIKTVEQVFTEKGSMEDYFKNKLASFKSKSKSNISNVNENYLDQDEPDYSFCGFSQEADDNQFCVGLGCNEEKESINDNSSIKNTVGSSDKLKKKKKNSKVIIDTNFTDTSNNTQYEELVNQSQEYIEGLFKKKKKAKNNIDNTSNNEEKSCQNDLEISIKSRDNILKKKKKSKRKISDLEKNVEINKFVVTDEHEQGHVSSKKKKKKNKSNNLEQCEENAMIEKIIKKKKSKIKIEEENIEHNIHLIGNIDNNLPKKNKKKKCRENV